MPTNELRDRDLGKNMGKVRRKSYFQRYSVVTRAPSALTNNAAILRTLDRLVSDHIGSVALPFRRVRDYRSARLCVATQNIEEKPSFGMA